LHKSLPFKYGVLLPEIKTTINIERNDISIGSRRAGNFILQDDWLYE